MARGRFVLASACLLAACVPSPGPFVLGAVHGRVVDQDTGEPIRGAEVIEWYRGAGNVAGPQPEYHARWSRSDADGRFHFGRSVAASPRMWLFKTYGPSFSFYHPSYGLEHGGALPEAAGEEIELRGSLRRSGERLRDLAPYCRGEHAGPGARHLAEQACPLSAHTTYPNGTRRARGETDARGRRTGAWTFYYEEGSVAARGQYRAGGATGVWVFYDRTGKTVRRDDPAS